MFVDSSLQVYTTIVAWRYYSMIWSLLAGTGIIFLPVIMVIIEQMIEARRYGSIMSNDGDRVLSNLESKLLMLFLLMFFVAMPINFVQLTPDSVQTYENTTDLTTPPTVTGPGTCGATNSSFDDMESAYGEAICSTSTAVPLWWYVVLRISHALTQTVVNEVTAQSNHGFRALTSYAQGAKIEDANLRTALNRFSADCHMVALSRYSRETSGQAIGPGTNDPGWFGRDVSWMGGAFLVENYYPEIRTAGAAVGLPFDANENTGVDTTAETPESGRVNCLDYWDYIKESVFTEATSAVAGDNRASRWDAMVAGIPGLGNDMQNKLVKLYIENTPATPSLTTDRIHALQNQNAGLVQKVANGAGEVYQAAELAKLSFTATMMVDALIKALPILQAYFLMFIVFMLPFGLVFSGYSWGFIVQSTALVFFVIFWSALWGFAGWIDESMARALWPGGTDGIWGAVDSYVNGEGAKTSMNKLIHSIITGLMYITGPTVAGWVLFAAGFRAVSTAAPTTGTASVAVGQGGASGVANAGSRIVNATASRRLK